ncbi:MAG: hypothetical protein M3N45_03190 [Actinomycetota bacterium]|nr:hypothetical protein [Actinomycetota bacterium]
MDEQVSGYGRGPRALSAVPDLAFQLFEKGLAVLVTLLVCSNPLQVLLGEGVELFLDLLDVRVVVAFGRLAARRDFLAGFSGGLRVSDVLLALFGALALRFLRYLPLFGAELLSGFLRQVTLRLTTFAGLPFAFPYCHSSSVHRSRCF